MEVGVSSTRSTGVTEVVIDPSGEVVVGLMFGRRSSSSVLVYSDTKSFSNVFRDVWIRADNNRRPLSFRSGSLVADVISH